MMCSPLLFIIGGESPPSPRIDALGFKSPNVNGLFRKVFGKVPAVFVKVHAQL